MRLPLAAWQHSSPDWGLLLAFDRTGQKDMSKQMKMMNNVEHVGKPFLACSSTLSGNTHVCHNDEKQW